MFCYLPSKHRSLLHSSNDPFQRRMNDERPGEQSDTNKPPPVQLKFPLSLPCLRKLILSTLLNLALNPQQQRRLPLIQLAHLIIRIQLVRELLLVALLDSPHEIHEQLMLPLACKCRVHVAVLFESALRSDHILGRQVADTRLEEVFLDAVAHQVAVDRLVRHLLVVVDGLLVLAVYGGDVGYLEPELVCEAVYGG